MKKFKNVLSILFVVAILLSYKVVQAEGEVVEPVIPDPVSIHLKIYAGDTALFDEDTTVTACPESPAADAPLTVNGKCAIEQSGLSNTWTWDYAPSGWLDEVDGYSTTSDFSKFWGWYSDLNLGQTGLNQHILDGGEELLLTYDSYPLRISSSQDSGNVGSTIIFTVEEIGFENFNPVWLPSGDATVTLGAQSCTTTVDGTCSITLNALGSLSATGSKALHVPSESIDIEVSALSSGGGGGSRKSKTKNEGSVLGATTVKFDTSKAYEFLIKNQLENGSFGENLYTDWSALALASGNYQPNVIKLIKYLGEVKPSVGSRLTDYERHAMALMSLGLNPYNTNGENYIAKIVSGFDGKQFGEVIEDNDDIFALIVLLNAGYTEDEKMVTDSLNFILGRQHENGSWDESVDMTGAALELLSYMRQNEPIKNALDKGKNFLKETQKTNGGWGDSPSSTAWALEGIIGLGEKPEDWKKDKETPLSYLATLQDTDGSVKNENINNKIWETAYVLSALSGKTWNQTIQKFAKQEVLIVSKPLKTSTQAKKLVAKKFTAAPKAPNTAAVVESLPTPPTPPEPPIETEAPKKSWLGRLLEAIF